MLGNVLGQPQHALQRPRHALQYPWPTSTYFAMSQAYFVMSQACLATSLADLGMLLQDPRSLTSKRNPPTRCLISCKAKRVVYHQTSKSETQWYITPLVSQLIRQRMGEFLFDMGHLGRCKSMPRSVKDVAKHAQDVAKHAQDVAKYAYTSQVPTYIHIYIWMQELWYIYRLNILHKSLFRTKLSIKLVQFLLTTYLNHLIY